jgi:hypothetical protein
MKGVRVDIQPHPTPSILEWDPYKEAFIYLLFLKEQPTLYKEETLKKKKKKIE